MSFVCMIQNSVMIRIRNLKHLFLTSIFLTETKWYFKSVYHFFDVNMVIKTVFHLIEFESVLAEELDSNCKILAFVVLDKW